MNQNKACGPSSSQSKGRKKRKKYKEQGIEREGVFLGAEYSAERKTASTQPFFERKIKLHHGDQLFRSKRRSVIPCSIRDKFCLRLSVDASESSYLAWVGENMQQPWGQNERRKQDQASCAKFEKGKIIFGCSPLTILNVLETILFFCMIVWILLECLSFFVDLCITCNNLHLNFTIFLTQQYLSI